MINKHRAIFLQFNCAQCSPLISLKRLSLSTSKYQTREWMSLCHSSRKQPLGKFPELSRLVLSTMQILGGCFTINLTSSVVLIQKRKRWWYVDIIGPYLFTHEISHLRIYRIKHEESKNNKPQRKKWAWVKNRQSPINSDVGLRCFRQLEVSMVAKLNNVELPQGGKGEQ